MSYRQTRMATDPTDMPPSWLDGRLGPLAPGKKLMYAMIKSAVEDIRRVRSPYQLPRPLRAIRIRERARAIAWVAANDTAWSHSFLNCCDELGWWPVMVRACIQRDIESTEPLVDGADDGPAEATQQ